MTERITLIGAFNALGTAINGVWVDLIHMVDREGDLDPEREPIRRLLLDALEHSRFHAVLATAAGERSIPSSDWCDLPGVRFWYSIPDSVGGYEGETFLPDGSGVLWLRVEEVRAEIAAIAGELPETKVEA